MFVEGMTLFLFLLFKHAVADLYLQSLIHYSQKKSNYFSLMGQVHYLQHGILAFLVLMFFVSWQFALLLSLLDYLAHWNIDHIKSRTQKYFGIQAPSRGYWFFASIDQMLHYLTYYVIVLLAY